MKPDVAVIGGGWAGCAAALTLAETGTRVTLYESSRTLGGRARAVEFDGRTLDNGQHVLLGAYTQTLQLIRHVHPAHADDVLWRQPLHLAQPPGFEMTCPRLPAPLHLLAGLLGARGLSWAMKWQAIRWAHGLLRTVMTDDRLTVSQLTARQPDLLNRLLWHPLCVSALNTPPAIASARVFSDVLRAAFGGRARHSDLLLPRCDLTALFPAPAARRITQQGGKVRLSSRVNRITHTGSGLTLGLLSEEAHHSHVILAVAPQHVAGLVATLPELASDVTALAGYDYQPIATAYVQFAADFRLPHPMLALSDGPAQFVFDRGQSHGQAGLMALVASAARRLPADWVRLAEHQLVRLFPTRAASSHHSIVEKQATYACVPGLPRPTTRTTHPLVFLAGDYTASPYPATLESATSSGVQSARALLEHA